MFYKVNDKNEIIETCIENYDGNFLETDKEIEFGFDNKLYFVEDMQKDNYLARKQEFEKQAYIVDLRAKRDDECFSVVDRGSLWYETLTDTQKEELKVWHQAWLNVTETKIIPEKPSWLK